MRRINWRRPSAGHAAPAEILEPRTLFAAGAATRIDPALLALHEGNAVSSRLVVDAEQRVAVSVHADRVNAASNALIAAAGFQVTASRPDLHLIEGTLPIASLPLVDKIRGAGRFAVRPIYAPLTFTGSVKSQADFVMESNRVRATSPGLFTGSGQRVGVLSDSYNFLGGAAAGQASGDLPAAGLTVIQDSAGADEGRAMLELVRDIAPGASLAFATANGGQLNFANNIRALANPAQGNATVIVDDAGYVNEPMFQDGVIAQAIDEVVTTRNVAYFSAAGNRNGQAYESTAFQITPDTVTRASGTTVVGTFYDFNTGAGVDTRQRITIPANGEILLSLQWDDPFFKTQADASHVDTDLDIFLINPATGLIVASAETDNISFNDPVEVLGYTNPNGSPLALDVAIRKFTGPNSGRIKYVNYGDAGITFNEFGTSDTPSVIPHAAAANGQAVAAVPYFNQQAVEAFSSRGPSTIHFTAAGNPIAAQTRATPQIAALDGTNTTFFGSDLEGDGRPNFFGTSAAAAHAAAVAALVRQANPSFTPAQVYARLQSTADDIVAPGVDAASGAGLINAFDAVYPTIAPASLNFSDGLESGALSKAYETRSTGAGRVVVSTTDGPATGARHLVLDSSYDPGGSALNEVTLHANLGGTGVKTLSFRQKEFADDDHAMPAGFTNSSDSDGVAISVDGVNWFRVVSLTGVESTGSYALKTYDLNAIATAAGITLTSDTRIRFQQFDDSPTNGVADPDGMAFDDIAITVRPTWLQAGSAAAWNPATGTLTVTGPATIIADPQNSGDNPIINASGGGAAVTINPTSGLAVHAASLNLSGGASAAITSLGGARTPANHRVLVVNGLSIDSASRLDITDNDVIVDYTGGSPIGAVEADVAAGYNVTGDWLGNGIVSSIAATDGNFTAAVADNALLAAPFGSAQGGVPFAGQNVDLTTVMIKFTHRADVNLDGLVTPDDSAVFGGNYDENQFAMWSTGDMNFDGLFTPDDAAIFGGAYDETLPLI